MTKQEESKIRFRCRKCDIEAQLAVYDTNPNFKIYVGSCLQCGSEMEIIFND